ncbi:hypothetical protein [Lelliottia wanjuensis]|uniref:hypothetical protein n=1 Tax=Lelliottia wanjuensis TaxID=3050585 RepID=UPI002549E41B|nr:hypothetical protein [Lelliottia sp. V86_10]MDK9585791.1 hypothetical protein [Lelliottia sp. V86_10]
MSDLQKETIDSIASNADAAIERDGPCATVNLEASVLKSMCEIIERCGYGNAVAWWKPGQFRPIFTERKQDSLIDKRYKPLFGRHLFDE